MPKLSIIIPIYNSQEYLEDCLDSVLAQTFSDFELILVNDGSSDNSDIICEKYKSIDPRIIVLNKKNSGAASARNLGLDNARGEYIGFVDSDDYIHPQMYEILYEIIMKTGSDIAACHYQFVRPEYHEKFEIYDDKIYNYILTQSCEEILESFDEHCRRVSLISPCMRLCKAEIFKELRFKEGYIEEDSILLLDLLGKSSSISKIKIPLYYWTENPNSVTRSDFNYKRFSFIRVSYERVLFFERRKNKRLSRIFRREFMNRCVGFAIKAKEVHLEQEYKEYYEMYRHNFLKYVFSSGFCKFEILMHFMFRFRISYFKKIYSKLQLGGEAYFK